MTQFHQIFDTKGNDSPAPKIGAGHAQAMLRGGFTEIGQIFKALPDSIEPSSSEYGLFGTALPQEIHENRHGPRQNMDHNMEPAMDM